VRATSSRENTANEDNDCSSMNDRYQVNKREYTDEDRICTHVYKYLAIVS
jgi:hypothetical protein